MRTQTRPTRGAAPALSGAERPDGYYALATAADVSGPRPAGRRPGVAGGPLAPRVERALREKEPEWVLAPTPPGGGLNPHLDEGFSFSSRRKGRSVRVAGYAWKEMGWATHASNGSTITPVMRRGHKPSKDVEELRGLVDQVAFFQNRSLDGCVESHDAAFMPGRMVVVVRAREAGAAQRFALHVAGAPPARRAGPP